MMKQLKNIKIPTTIKNIFTEGNREIVIGLLTILILLWLVLYAIPGLFVSLFNTFLGNIILLLIIVIIGFKNYKYAIGLAIILMILYRFEHLSLSSKSLDQKKSEKEGFELSKKSIEDFLIIQNTINPHIIFDPKKLKEQVTQEELNYFLRHGMWPWSPEVVKLYEASVSSNPYIRTSPKDSANEARTIYNEAAILEIISWQTKEGQFLTNGVQIMDGTININETLPSGWGNYGYSSGLISHMNDVIKCNIDPYGKKSKLERIHFTGKDLITGEQTKTIEDVDYRDLPKIIKNFRFKRGACNPCSAVNSPADYRCPFEIDIPGKNKGISAVWKYLWGL